MGLHRVRSERDDRHAASGSGLQGTNGRRRFEPVHPWHVQVHQHDVEPAITRRGDRVLTILDGHDPMPALLEPDPDEPGVDVIVLGEQHMQAAAYERGSGYSRERGAAYVARLGL